MYIRRPLCLFAAIFALITWIGVALGVLPAVRGPAEVPPEKARITLTGTVRSKEWRTLGGAETLVLFLQSEPRSIILCYMDSECEKEPCIGQTVTVTGRAAYFKTATNPGEFDSRSYYQSLNIFYKLQNTSVTAASADYSETKEQLYILRRKLGLLIDRLYPEPESGAVKAMLLGERSSLDQDLKDLYQTAGILHILSISGLHISLFGAGLIALLRKTPLPDPVNITVALLIMYLYGVMTGMGISAIRALTMFVLQLLAKPLLRSYDMLTAMAFIAVILLAEHPLYILHSGFQLSFGAILALGFFHPWIASLFSTEPESTLRSRIVRSISPGISLALVTLPLQLHMSFCYPLYSLLINLMVIPLMTIVLFGSVVSLLTGLVYLFGGKLLALPVSFILRMFMLGGKAAAFLPSANVIIGDAQVWRVFLYYLVLSVLCVIFSGGIRLPTILQKILIIAGIMLLVRKEMTGLSVFMLDVGQGDGIVLVNERKHAILFDGGSTSKKEVGKYQIIPFLKSCGIGHLEGIFLSHPDEDHISGAVTIMEESDEGGITVEGLYLPLLPQEQLEKHLTELILTARDNGIPVYFVGEGDELRDGRLQILCCSPSDTLNTDEPNEMSESFLIRYGRFSMLMTGDITGEPELRMLERAESELDGSLSVLKVAHHGSRYSTPKILLDELKPRIALISAGTDNRYGHPHEETLERLEDAGTRIYNTAQSGEITVWTDGRDLRVKEFLRGVPD